MILITLVGPSPWEEIQRICHKYFESKAHIFREEPLSEADVRAFVSYISLYKDLIISPIFQCSHAVSLIYLLAKYQATVTAVMGVIKQMSKIQTDIYDANESILKARDKLVVNNNVWSQYNCVE